MTAGCVAIVERSERAQHVFLPLPAGVVLEVPAEGIDEPEAPTGTEDAPALFECPILVGKGGEGKRGESDVERLVGKVELFGVHLAQFGVAEVPVADCRGGAFEHRCRQVDADHLTIFTASFGGGEEHLSGARCDVEDPVARTNVHVLDEPSCEVGEMAGSNRVVGRGGPREDADHCLLR